MIARIIGVGLLFSFLAGCANQTTVINAATPELAAKKWAAKHKKRLPVTVDQSTVNRLTDASCSEGGFMPLRFVEPGVDISLFFNCRPGEKLSADQLPGKFSHAVFDQLPHHLQYPNWEFRLLTHSSSISQGVEFARVKGVEVVRIKTPLYMLYGNQTTPECLVAAGQVTPKACMVQVPLTTEAQVTIKFLAD